MKRYINIHMSLRVDQTDEKGGGWGGEQTYPNNFIILRSKKIKNKKGNV